MSVPTIALIPPKPKLNIPPRKLDVDICPACQRPLQNGDNCRCAD